MAMLEEEEEKVLQGYMAGLLLVAITEIKVGGVPGLSYTAAAADRTWGAAGEPLCCG